MCLAQGHKAVMLVRRKPVARRSRVKHYTAEQLRSLALNSRFVHIFGVFQKWHLMQSTWSRKFFLMTLNLQYVD